MSDELKDQRIPIMMTASEVAAIDDWSFSNRIRSRAEAIRRLCQAGLALEEREGARKTIVDTYLAHLKSADDALGRLQDQEDNAFAERLADYVDSVSAFMDIADAMLMEVVYLRGFINSATSHEDVERFIRDGQQAREAFKNHVFLGGELVRFKDEKDQ